MKQDRLFPILLMALAALACTFPGIAASTQAADSPAAATLPPLPPTPSLAVPPTTPPTLPPTASAYSLPGSSEVWEETTYVESITLIETTTVQHYAIVAPDAESVAAVMAEQGPGDSVGNHWWALTEPLFDWRYACQCSDAGCITGPVTVYVSTTIQLPEWAAPDADLSARWASFYAALRAHEVGHQALAGDCGLALGQALIAVVPQPTCEALPAALTAATQPIFAGCRAAQIAYETDTAHGISDGVVWP